MFIFVFNSEVRSIPNEISLAAIRVSFWNGALPLRSTLYKVSVSDGNRLKNDSWVSENEILPLYYDNKDTWRQVVKNGMRDVQFQFDSNRMANEYYEILYA